MTNTQFLNLPLIDPAQAQKHVTHNEALLMLDAMVQLSVVDRHLTQPPESATDGDRYLVAVGAEGAWLGRDQQVTARIDGVWRFFPPQTGWTAWIEDEAKLLAWNGSSWVAFADLGGASGLTAGDLSDGALARIGVNTQSNETDRLAVKSDAVLFSHDDVTPGNGDVRTKLNKKDTGHTASFIFQNNWQGRAEFGLIGSDQFSLKVSSDGGTWRQALVVDEASGMVTMPQRPVFHAHSIPAISSGVVVFSSNAVNNGSHYNNANGRFTAPLAGHYQFAVTLFFDTHYASSQQGYFQFYINGAPHPTRFHTTVGSAQGYQPLSATVICDLNEGDYVEVRVTGSSGATTYIGNYSCFCGHLIG